MKIPAPAGGGYGKLDGFMFRMRREVAGQIQEKLFPGGDGKGSFVNPSLNPASSQPLFQSPPRCTPRTCFTWGRY